MLFYNKGYTSQTHLSQSGMKKVGVAVGSWTHHHHHHSIVHCILLVLHVDHIHIIILPVPTNTLLSLPFLFKSRLMVLVLTKLLNWVLSLNTTDLATVQHLCPLLCTYLKRSFITWIFHVSCSFRLEIYEEFPNSIHITLSCSSLYFKLDISCYTSRQKHAGIFLWIECKQDL
mgnify:CR=1 FL=1